jgi:hypothetical protein
MTIRQTIPSVWMKMYQECENYEYEYLYWFYIHVPTYQRVFKGCCILTCGFSSCYLVQQLQNKAIWKHQNGAENEYGFHVGNYAKE